MGDITINGKPVSENYQSIDDLPFVISEIDRQVDCPGFFSD